MLGQMYNIILLLKKVIYFDLTLAVFIFLPSLTSICAHVASQPIFCQPRIHWISFYKYSLVCLQPCLYQIVDDMCIILNLYVAHPYSYTHNESKLIAKIVMERTKKDKGTKTIRAGAGALDKDPDVSSTPD